MGDTTAKRAMDTLEQEPEVSNALGHTEMVTRLPTQVRMILNPQRMFPGHSG